MSGPSLKKHDNGIWYVHWTEGRRSRRITTGETELAPAKRFLGSWLLLETSRETRGDENPLVAQLWNFYWEKHVLRETASPSTIEYGWKALEPHFGDLVLSDVNQDQVDAYVKARTTGRLGRKVKPATVKRELAYLAACINFAVSKRIVPVGLAPQFIAPSSSPPRDRWLTTAEIARLHAATAAARVGKRLSRLERFLWIALETGARKQAVLDLTWDRVDFETGVIHFSPSGKHETSKRSASVPISISLMPVLRRAHAEKTGQVVLDNKGNVWVALQNAVRAAGLAPAERHGRNAKPKRTGISPHILRHTAATHMARRGVPLWIIAKVLGNSMRMVEMVYAKHAPDDLRAAVNSISNVFKEAAE